MRILRNLLLAIACSSVFFSKVLLAQSIPANQLILPSQSSTLSFIWQGDSIHSKWEEHVAMLIPVYLKNCPRRFYMQFDLGAASSLLYKKSHK